MTQQTPLHGQEPREQDLVTPHGPMDTPDQRQIVEPSFGTRLRAARKAKRLDLEACGHALQLPARVLRQLEGGQYDGIAGFDDLLAFYRRIGLPATLRELGLDGDVSVHFATIARHTLSAPHMRNFERPVSADDLIHAMQAVEAGFSA